MSIFYHVDKAGVECYRTWWSFTKTMFWQSLRIFIIVAVALGAMNLFFPRDLLPYKCTNIHKIHQEKLTI